MGLTFAFTAGVFALFSPCAFPMFPGYISYYLGLDAPSTKAIAGGTVCALGLLAVFCVISLIASAMGSLVFTYLPFLELIAGLSMILMGVAMIIGINLPAFWPSTRAPKQRGFPGIFLYGVAYGLATVGCSAPIFFSVLFYAVTSGEPVRSVLTFIAYALGMALPLIITTVVVARSRDLIVKRIVRIAPFLHRISGMVLIFVGVYLASSYFRVV